ncbi:hypothetical protein [Pseudarthrobacter sp. NamB4]|uniref:hypothetical protein n=1 Tax=Pseudarthrobacter sp. NamB4 TaxID=2576837 RepID=UPI0010FE2C29|nr:hypothetical protein [Pseudarthrobacter sp. NamB4]TLM72955.1 hypothetical protein FDW81_11425 [Pseudarthrobacter sp. NamB4]
MDECKRADASATSSRGSQTRGGASVMRGSSTTGRSTTTAASSVSAVLQATARRGGASVAVAPWAGHIQWEFMA